MKTPLKKRIGSWTLPDECLACGAENSYRRKLTCTAKVLRGETFTVKHHHWVCASCNVGILGDAEIDEAMHATVAAYQAAHHLLTAREIQTARKTKQWTQKDLAGHSSLGIATVKRLELGSVVQTKANDIALRKALRHDDPEPVILYSIHTHFQTERPMIFVYGNTVDLSIKGFRTIRSTPERYGLPEPTSYPMPC